MSINEIISTEFATIFNEGNPLSLADILNLLSISTTLSVTRKRDLRSAITRFANLVGRRPEHLPADAKQLTPLLLNIHPAQVRMSAKTLQNIKSNLLAALHHTKHYQQLTRKREKLSAVWLELYTQLPDKHFHSGLSRFVHFISAHEIAPKMVNDETVQAFIKDLAENSFIQDKKLHGIHRRTTRLWNEASTTIKDWPNQTLTVPDFRTPRTTRSLSDFPVTFQKEVEHYLDWLKDDDLLAKDRPPRKCQPRTIRLRRSQIQLAASALVKKGSDIGTVQSLTDLVQVDATKDILRHYLDGKNKATSFIRGLVITLIAIAQHWIKVPDAQLDELKTIKHKLGSQLSGLTEKNRRTLRQFENPHNRHLLLGLPEQLISKSKTQSKARAAITIQLSVAIEILLMAPIRMVNLISLRFDHNLVSPSGHQGNYHLVLSEDETKNAQPLEFQFPQQLTQLINRYRTDHLPSLINEPNAYLFPNKGSSHKSQATLSQQIKEIVYKHTGLQLTVHQFRHLAAMLFLEAYPGQYETVRQLLGHKNLKTTTNFYTGMNTKEATRVFDELILGERLHHSKTTHINKKRRK